MFVYNTFEKLEFILQMIHSIDKWVDVEECGDLEPLKQEVVDKVNTQFGQSVAVARCRAETAATSSDTEHTTDSL